MVQNNENCLKEFEIYNLLKLIWVKRLRILVVTVVSTLLSVIHFSSLGQQNELEVEFYPVNFQKIAKLEINNNIRYLEQTDPFNTYDLASIKKLYDNSQIFENASFEPFTPRDYQFGSVVRQLILYSLLGFFLGTMFEIICNKFEFKDGNIE